METVESSKLAESTRRKILIVDDDTSIARVLTTVVHKFGRPQHVDCGNKAIELLKKIEFDLILTDYEMDQGNGLDLLAFLEKNKIKTPVIMLTAFGTRELVIKTIQYHVFG